MSSVVISGNTSGSVSLVAPDVAGSSVQTLASVSGTLAPLVSGTAVTASGTSVDFTGIPSWVKRITVMFNGVSTSGTSNILIQIGATSFTTTGYTASAISAGGTNIVSSTTSTAGYPILFNAAANQMSGMATITNINLNTWICSHTISPITAAYCGTGAGNSSNLSGTLDRVRITTVNGTDTFDAGTINIMYE